MCSSTSKAVIRPQVPERIGSSLASARMTRMPRVACDVSRGIRVLERDGLPAVLLQDPGIAAARGADVQRPAGTRQPPQLAAQDGTAFPVPPVVVFQRGQQLEFGGIHDLTSTACP